MDTLTIIGLIGVGMACAPLAAGLIPGAGAKARTIEQLATRAELERERSAREALGSELRIKQTELEVSMRDRVGKVHHRIDELVRVSSRMEGKLEAFEQAQQAQGNLLSEILREVTAATKPNDPNDPSQ